MGGPRSLDGLDFDSDLDGMGKSSGAKVLVPFLVVKACKE